MAYTGADFGVIGFGEVALPQLIKALRHKDDLSGIDNLAYHKDGRIAINRVAKADYASIPQRRRNIVNNEWYYGTSGMGNIEARRGCFMKCGYCAEPQIVGSDVCHHNIQQVLNELKELRGLGIEYVHFCDSEFNVGDSDETNLLLKEMIDQKVDVKYTTFMHPRTEMMTEEFVRLLKESGCQEVTLTVDSGCEEMLQKLDKLHTTEDVIKSSELIKKYNIRLVHTYLLGGPGEDFSTVDKSVELMKECEPHIVQIFVGIRIYPNTSIARMAREEGIIDESTDLLAPVFYRPERVTREFIPYLKRKTKGVRNCLIPMKNIDFLNLLCQHIYMNGFRGSFSDFIDEVKRIPFTQKARILGKTILAYFFS